MEPEAFSALEERMSGCFSWPSVMGHMSAVALVAGVVTSVPVAVSQALRENTYPFLAVIMLKDRRMTVVGRLEGLIQADDLINQLTFIMDANQTYLVSERLER